MRRRVCRVWRMDAVGGIKVRRRQRVHAWRTQVRMPLAAASSDSVRVPGSLGVLRCAIVVQRRQPLPLVGRCQWEAHC